MDAKYQELLRLGSARLGVHLDDHMMRQFGVYLDLLLRWNRRIKLTSIVEVVDVVERHFLDSLAVVPQLHGTTLVDVGSGAGFPGLAVAIACPQLAVSLVESIQKKAAFLEAVKRELALGSVRVHAERMEAQRDRGARYDTAVSRATFAPQEWILRGAPLVSAGGSLIAMVVPDADRSLESWAPTWQDHFADGRLTPSYAPGRALVVLAGRTAR